MLIFRVALSCRRLGRLDQFGLHHQACASGSGGAGGVTDRHQGTRSDGTKTAPTFASISRHVCERFWVSSHLGTSGRCTAAACAARSGSERTSPTQRGTQAAAAGAGRSSGQAGASSTAAGFKQARRCRPQAALHPAAGLLHLLPAAGCVQCSCPSLSPCWRSWRAWPSDGPGQGAHGVAGQAGQPRGRGGAASGPRPAASEGGQQGRRGGARSPFPHIRRCTRSERHAGRISSTFLQTGWVIGANCCGSRRRRRQGGGGEQLVAAAPFDSHRASACYSRTEDELLIGQDRLAAEATSRVGFLGLARALGRPLGPGERHECRGSAPVKRTAALDE